MRPDSRHVEMENKRIRNRLIAKLISHSADIIDELFRLITANPPKGGDAKARVLIWPTVVGVVGALGHLKTAALPKGNSDGAALAVLGERTTATSLWGRGCPRSQASPSLRLCSSRRRHLPMTTQRCWPLSCPTPCWRLPPWRPGSRLTWRRSGRLSRSAMRERPGR